MCFKEKYRLYKNTIFFLFLLFCLIITAVSLFSLNISSIQSGSFYFRFGLFALAASVLIEEKTSSKLYFIFIIVYLFSFIF